MIITIKDSEVNDGSYGQYLQVRGVADNGQEVTKNVGKKFVKLWPDMTQGSVWNFKLKQSNDKWIIADIIPMSKLVPEPDMSKAKPVPTPDQKEIDKVNEKPKTRDDIIRDNMEWKDQQIEKNMWYKELGEMLRAKDIDTSKPHGRLLRQAYYAKMFQVLGLEFKEE